MQSRSTKELSELISRGVGVNSEIRLKSKILHLWKDYKSINVLDKSTDDSMHMKHKNISENIFTYLLIKTLWITIKNLRTFYLYLFI